MFKVYPLIVIIYYLFSDYLIRIKQEAHEFFIGYAYRHASESSIIRYAKIAMSLPNKTVRDVALRCRWMTVS